MSQKLLLAAFFRSSFFFAFLLLLLLLLQFCIFLFTSFARMFERFECLNADGVREQIESMYKVSSWKSESEVEVVIAQSVPGGNKN